MNRLSRSVLHTWLATAPLWLLAACAELHVRNVSPSPHAPAYELRGPSVAHVQAEVSRLCPHGHEVLRQSERQTRVAGDHMAARWWNRAAAWLDDDDTQVQMAVACKAAPTPTPTPTP
ncbi:MAG TPA: hypothetical protein VFW84_13895 [Aquabacterium sp.]|uniref:hypothetical protein n=1 Tax=Aquabacterium sp. TaxID=1872578 RepID=UPI002D83A7A1|nr:hypothetical protein [Aquabacterium sp.]HET6789170.1 hypothetical protein [Aquabacterium sp.]HEX5373814.1 hypothetical protein [Aquabacterium sp.]